MGVISSITVILLVVICACFYIIHHPQIVVGALQKALYKGNPINSFEPFHDPSRRIKADGSLYVTEIAYSSEYPNSYLDVTYPTEDTTVDRPTVIYFHGGGYFGGDKVWGDPMAVDDDANRLFEEIVAHGYNFVNVNYALVPDYHFPVPLIQMSQAIDFLAAHADEYGLNMKRVLIFGQSAGAILTAQYGALLTNSEYREQMDIYPSLSTAEVKALIIDDAPLLTEAFHLRTKMLIAHYLACNNMSSDVARKYNAYRYVNEAFPPSFMTAGNIGGFPKDMQALSDKLESLGVEHEYFFTEREIFKLPHGYLNQVKENPYARDCFDSILAFMDRYAKQ